MELHNRPSPVQRLPMADVQEQPWLLIFFSFKKKIYFGKTGKTVRFPPFCLLIIPEDEEKANEDYESKIEPYPSVWVITL